MLLGSIWGSIVVAYERPLLGFGIGTLVGFLVTIAGVYGTCTDEILERNEYAQVKDYFLEKYETEYRR